MKYRTFGFVTLFALLSSSSAKATEIVYTYSGTVLSGYDFTGVFGSANTDLSGASFKVIETFGISNAPYTKTDGSTYSVAYGGSGYGTAGFGISQVTINGVTDPDTISGSYDTST